MNKNKNVTIYIKKEEYDQIVKEAKRLERSKSWIVRYAWRYGYINLKKIKGNKK